jgi:hypothetical protein
VEEELGGGRKKRMAVGCVDFIRARARALVTVSSNREAGADWLACSKLLGGPSEVDYLNSKWRQSLKSSDGGGCECGKCLQGIKIKVASILQLTDQ